MCAVTAPVNMNVNTAASERGERRDKPHNPCPEVHPPDRRVPNPVRRPATRSDPVESAVGDPKASGLYSASKAPAETNPDMYVKFQFSPFTLTIPSAIPESPVIFPVRNMNALEETPRIAPPRRPF
jgi:hypothetical protein